MGKKYLETKKGSLEEQVSLLEYYDPQYEGMTVAEVAALDEDALGVSIAQGLMKHAKKGGFKIGGKAWNSSAMLSIRKKIGTSSSKARAVKTDLEKQKNKTKAQAAANSDKSELEARKKAKKDGELSDITVTMLPAEMGLSSAYPNPFNPTTSVDLVVPVDGYVSVKVYNLAGQVVSTIHDGNLKANIHTFSWDAMDAASGMYLIRAEMAGAIDTKKIMLLK